MFARLRKVKNLFISEIEECMSQPCRNNGSCREAVNGYTCACESGYSGTNCEKGQIIYTVTFVTHDEMISTLINMSISGHH